MPQLDFTQPPFDVLSLAEQQSIKKNTQVRYLDKNEKLKIDAFSYFFVVLKGHINEMQSDIFVSDYTASSKNNAKRNDWFRPKLDHTYTAIDQTLLLQIKGATVDKISAQNRLVRQMLSSDVGDKINALKHRNRGSRGNLNNSLNEGQKNQAEAQQLMLQPVTNISLLPVHIVDETTSIITAAQTMTEAGLKHILVKRHSSNERHPTESKNKGFIKNLGIITDTDICRSIAEGMDPNSTTCKHYTSFNLRTIDHHNDISDALLTMIRYHIHRLPVVDDFGNIRGILGQTDLLTYISNHSQLITVQIDQSTDLISLTKAVEMIGKYIRTQHQNGIKVGVISRMVQTLNAQVFTKLWQLLVPDIIFENTCVIVMGSEGRGEQIMRTDQDNALIVRNGFNHPDIAHFSEQFNQALSDMGYPLCDGHIMMNNPMWRLSLSRMQQQISSWFNLTEPNHAIWLSAVLDASYVCGDESLLSSLREHMQIARHNTDPMLIRQFARAALSFGEVNQWWQRFTPFKGKTAAGNPSDIDLKKAGIFPLVHGIRTMAMEKDIYHITSTKGRLKALARAGVMSEKRAETLAETLEFFMGQRLSVALSTDDKHARQVDPTTLSALERDLLKECLNLVKSYKTQLVIHYQLDYV